jgi:hypothetical protein
MSSWTFSLVILNEVKDLWSKNHHKDSSLTLRMTGDHIILNIKCLRKVLAGQGIASKISKILKHKGLRPSIKTQNEKLFKILIKKQAVHRD